MNKIMNIKKVIACALVAFATVCPAWATIAPVASNTNAATAEIDEEDLLNYTSTATGLSFFVPRNAKEKQDKAEAVIVTAGNDEFIFTAIPFDFNSVSKEELGETIKTMAKAAKIDLNKSETFDGAGADKTVEFTTEIGEYANGGAGIVGIATVVKASKDYAGLCYLITIVASGKYAEYAGAALGSLSFNEKNIVED